MRTESNWIHFRPNRILSNTSAAWLFRVMAHRDRAPSVASHPIKEPDYATLNGNTILQIAPDGESGTDTRLDQVT